MSDEEFDRALRAALRRGLPGEAPSRLRRRASLIPTARRATGLHAGIRHVPRLGQLAAVVAALAATAALAWGLGGVQPASRGPASAPSASGAAAASASLGSPSEPSRPASPSEPQSSGPTGPRPAIQVGAMVFFDAAHGIVAGDGGAGSGVIWSTADGGGHWTRTALDGPAIAAMAGVATSTAWASSLCVDGSPLPCRPGLFRSEDGGRTWSRVSGRSLRSLTFVDPLRGWAVDASTDGVVSTGDGGATWTAGGAGPCPATWAARAVSFATASDGWVACSGVLSAGSGAKAILRTADGGRRWTTVARVDPFRSSGLPNVGAIPGDDYVSGIAMASASAGFAWEARGGLLRTSDGGASWRALPLADPALASVYAGAVLDDRSYLAVIWDNDGASQAQRLMATSDRGATWRLVAELPLPLS